jgi:predicted PurR-regulated permease PerM
VAGLQPCSGADLLIGQAEKQPKLPHLPFSLLILFAIFQHPFYKIFSKTTVMTDPASLTLVILGVVLPSIELARNIRSVFRESKNAPEQIERLENKIQISRDILHTLQPTSESYDDQSRRLIRSLQDDYATSLDRLEEIIKSLVSKPRWKSRYRLISSQREIQEIEDLVKELEGRINLIASISMWFVGSTAAKNIIR